MDTREDWQCRVDMMRYEAHSKRELATALLNRARQLDDEADKIEERHSK